jgi:hypothetical protein
MFFFNMSIIVFRKLEQNTGAPEGIYLVRKIEQMYFYDWLLFLILISSLLAKLYGETWVCLVASCYFLFVFFCGGERHFIVTFHSISSFLLSAHFINIISQCILIYILPKHSIYNIYLLDNFFKIFNHHYIII